MISFKLAPSYVILFKLVPSYVQQIIQSSRSPTYYVLKTTEKWKGTTQRIHHPTPHPTDKECQRYLEDNSEISRPR